MENRKDVLIRITFSVIVIILLTIIAIRKPHHMVAPIVNECKEDSLRSVVGQLKSELQIEEDGWDNKEKRYEQILFEYEYGLDHLKNYHPDAYREFHRIIGYKENFSRETERDNKKRLSVDKW